LQSRKQNYFKIFFKNLAGYFLILCFLVAPSILYAQSRELLGMAIEEEVKLHLGETKLFPAFKPTRVVVGKPEVADVVSATEENITLLTKSLGTTTFAYWDMYGEHFFKIKVLPEDMTYVKRRIDALLRELKLPKVHTQKNEDEGKVILLGEVPTEEDKARIDLALGELKNKTIDLIKVVEEGVIEISVKVLELDKDATKELGFDFPGSLVATETGEAISTAVSSASAFFKIGNWTRSDFSITLDALIQEGKARILSQPKLACLSGKEAELLVGGEKPIFTTTVAGSTGIQSTTVDYKEYGIKLNIQPTIKDKEKILISLNVEVSEVGAAEFIGSETAPTAKAYPLTKRTVSTELYLKNDQTLVIGGLIKQKNEEDYIRVAGLSKIPILGALFRHKTVTEGGGQGERGNIELFITLTPRIVINRESQTAINSVSAQDLSLESLSLSGSGVRNDELKDYIRSIMLKIANSVYYPEDAKQLGYEGIVRLNLYLNSDGSLKQAQIAQSSGYPLLDEVALDTVNNQAPYLPFPDELKADELKIEIPIAYLRDQ
jgi:pilus assembly protein CpaC